MEVEEKNEIWKRVIGKRASNRNEKTYNIKKKKNEKSVFLSSCFSSFSLFSRVRIRIHGYTDYTVGSEINT